MASWMLMYYVVISTAVFYGDLVLGVQLKLLRGTTYLQVWFSISQRDIYGFASAVLCE